MANEINSIKFQPLISIIVPTYNTNITFLREAIESVLSQIYKSWELIIIDDASPDDKVRDVITEYVAKDDRIKYKFLPKNKHISNATNEGIKIAKGEYISLFDHDDYLWPNALYEIVKALNSDKKIDFIYTDEDKIDENINNHFDPFFKPDFNFDMLRSMNYITHFTTIRKKVLDEFGYENGEYNGAQDWELFLRLTRNINVKNIHHIPKVLYSWRSHRESTAKSTGAKPYVVKVQHEVVVADLSSRNIKGAKIIFDDSTKPYFQIDYNSSRNPLVSIVIPNKNHHKVLERCIKSILKKTEYDNYEIIIVDTGSTDKEIANWYEDTQAKNSNIKVVNLGNQEFNFAEACNFGAENASGELLLMLNNDTEVISGNWLKRMAGYASLDGVGAVGCLLMYPDSKHIQHAGVAIGVGGCGSNMFTGWKVGTPLTLAQNVMLRSIHDVSAVTAACLMIRKSVFDKVGGFDKKFRINYNDVDLCLRLVRDGYRNVYLPNVKLLHHESFSRGLPGADNHDSEEFEAAQRLFYKRWSKYVKCDPDLNPNFSRKSANYELDIDSKN
jgi:GT2 family glycosyltransferase